MARPREFDEQQVLDQAVETFWSQSFGGTSTEDLCASTGLSRSSLYNTFKGKTDLYRQSLERYSDLKGEERQSYADRRGTGRKVLQQLLIDVLAEQVDRDDRRLCLAINAAVEIGLSDQTIAELTCSNLDGFRRLLVELIARGQADGSITSTVRPAELAAVVHAAVNGLQVECRVRQSPAQLTRTIKTLMSLL